MGRSMKEVRDVAVEEGRAERWPENVFGGGVLGNGF